MSEGRRASMEGLEGRVLFSTALFSSSLCLPTPSAPPPPTGPVVSSPTPGAVHHRRHRPGSSVTPSTIVPQILGPWQGSHVTNDQIDATLALNVTQSKTGELFADIGFTGSTSFQGKAQLTYDGVNQRFRLFVVSPRMIVRLDLTPIPNAGFPQCSGAIQIYTRHGALKTEIALQQSDIQPRPAL